jgi:amidohydrolase
MSVDSTRRALRGNQLACRAVATSAETRRLVPGDLEAQAIHWRRHLHARPELSFEEHETSAFVADLLHSFGGLEIEHPTPTSVVAVLRSGRPGKTLAFRADMDALPIQEENDVPYASTRPGVMHACAHDAHTAILLAAARILTERRDELAGELRFVFQHAEELPPGGAQELVDAGVMDGVDAVVGIHLFSTVPVGLVAAQPGPLLAFADTFRIEVHGRGGHAAAPHETVDPIVVAAQVVTNLQQLVSRTIDPLDQGVVSVTRISGGTAKNVIPETVELLGTVRTFKPETKTALVAGIERVLRGVTEAHGATYTFHYEDGYPAVVNDAEVAAIVEEAARAELGEHAVTRIEPVMGGEDFSAYLHRAPGAFFVVGTRNEAIGAAFPHHHPRFAIDEASLRDGIAVFARTALDMLG